MMLIYDESIVMRRLAVFGRVEMAAFGCACAEWLMPLFERYASSVGDVASGQRLRGVLAAVWLAVSDGKAVDQALQDVAEEMVPVDDGDWTLEMGYAQNAAAATAYAVRTWLTGDPQEAVWAARQVYEAADYAVLQGDSNLNLNRPGAGDEVLRSPIVQQALSAVEEFLVRLEDVSLSTAALREWSMVDGRRWAELIP